MSRLGNGLTPAFRGIAYVVFERLALAPYGNRIPQLSFEVHRPVEPFGQQIRGVVLIPGSGEFALATEPVAQVFGGGRARAENVHTRQGGCDWKVALDQMQDTLPNAHSVSLVVSWFGTRSARRLMSAAAGSGSGGQGHGSVDWGVAGLSREDAYLVSRRDGRASYGGTPSDASVVQAIQDLKARGFVRHAQSIRLDGRARRQCAARPVWWGRAGLVSLAGTHHRPSGGRSPGSPDKTAAAASQVAAFIGTVSPAHFSIAGSSVVYSGPDEWSYRRMVLHHAFLAKAAGGVGAFLIGSELRGLTTVRDGLRAIHSSPRSSVSQPM